MHVRGKVHEETHKGTVHYACTPSHAWKLCCHGMFTERCVSIYYIRPLEVKKWVTWCARLTAYTHWSVLQV